MDIYRNSDLALTGFGLGRATARDQIVGAEKLIHSAYGYNVLSDVDLTQRWFADLNYSENEPYLISDPYYYLKWSLKSVFVTDRYDAFITLAEEIDVQGANRFYSLVVICRTVDESTVQDNLTAIEDHINKFLDKTY